MVTMKNQRGLYIKILRKRKKNEKKKFQAGGP